MDRREALRAMVAGAGFVSLGGVVGGCSKQAGRSAPTRSPTTSEGSRRPLLGPGDRPDPTKPEGIDLLPKVEHIVIYMQENHSYDNYFGMLGRGDGFTLDAYGAPDELQPRPRRHAGRGVPPVRHVEPQERRGAGGPRRKHAAPSIDGGAMDGFARTEHRHDGLLRPGRPALLLRTGRHVRAVRPVVLLRPGPTYPNRRFLQAATSVGVTKTDLAEILADTVRAQRRDLGPAERPWHLLVRLRL